LEALAPLFEGILGSGLVQAVPPDGSAERLPAIRSRVMDGGKSAV